MIYPIYAYGHPVLKKKSIDLTNEQMQDKEFIKNLYDTMDYSNGIGLAAPQIGKNLRIFIIDSTKVSNEDDRLSENEEILRTAFINPKILNEYGGLVSMEEGCLSIPNVYGHVDRHENITIEYYDENLDFIKRDFTGFTARIIQHEYDHIEGKLFTEKLSPLKRKMIKNKLDKIKNGKTNSRYKMKFI